MVHYIIHERLYGPVGSSAVASERFFVLVDSPQGEGEYPQREGLIDYVASILNKSDTIQSIATVSGSVLEEIGKGLVSRIDKPIDDELIQSILAQAAIRWQAK